MTAGAHDFPCEQDVTFRQRVTWGRHDVQGNVVPYDLTGCTARMQIRSGYDVTPEFLTLTTENGGITLGGADGTIDVYMTPQQTNSLTVSKPRYDLAIIFPGGDVKRVLEGRMLVKRNITELP